jgi:uncharacterized protein YkwD
MKKILLLIILIGLVSLFIPSSNEVKTVSIEPEPIITPVEQQKAEIEELINNYRLENGKSTLRKDSYLCELAEFRLQEIKTDWSHDGFRKMTKNKYSSFGENLGRDWHSDNDVMRAWIASPTHNDILLGHWTNFCVSQEEGYYVLITGR